MHKSLIFTLSQGGEELSQNFLCETLLPPPLGVGKNLKGGEG